MKIKKLPEFDRHHSVVHIKDAATGLNAFIAFHRNSKKVPSFGATRLWKYKNEKDAVRDALRLSKLMSYKSALAGLKYGGAKATIIRNDKFPKSTTLLKYASELNKLSGRFITGADVGLDLNDVKSMNSVSKFIVGIKSNPAKYTALGILISIETICEKVFQTKKIKERTFAIQGVGAIGYEFLNIVYKKTGKIYVSDTDKKRLKLIKKLFPKIVLISPEKIHKQEVDIYMPCALSHSLNKQAIKELRCKIIVGAANNQLETRDIADKLYQKGIFYGPDYVVNAGGLISVVDEYENKNLSTKRIERKVRKIKNTLEKIIAKSDKEKKSPARIADEMAKKIINKMK
ncbi:MAG: Glu/Leu/Phe/Val dehydrogenase dimerization domain-containing protein [Candidatus Paceibacterota bacterium]